MYYENDVFGNINVVYCGEIDLNAIANKAYPMFIQNTHV